VLILVSNLMGLFPALHESDFGDECDVRARSGLFLYYNYIGIAEKRFIRSSEAPGWSHLVDRAADLSDRVDQ
jgi:hypothetical protein